MSMGDAYWFQLVWRHPQESRKDTQWLLQMFEGSAGVDNTKEESPLRLVMRKKTMLKGRSIIIIFENAAEENLPHATDRTRDEPPSGRRVM